MSSMKYAIPAGVRRPQDRKPKKVKPVAVLTLSLTVYSALWTEKDVAHGGNDPDLTSEQVETFDSVDSLVAYLRDQDLTEPSSWPVAGNELRIWYSERSKLIDDQEPFRLERTAHRGEGITDAMWCDVVRRVNAN